MQKPSKKLKIGIIATNNNKNDILSFNEELKLISQTLSDKVSLVIYGHNAEEDEKWLNDLDYEFVKPTSVIHYFKQIKALNLDIVLILLENTLYNATSEDYNKFLETALFKIPVLAPNLPPYNQLLRNGVNGFIYNTKENLINKIEEIMSIQDELPVIGLAAQEMMQKYFSYSEENTKVIDELFV